MRWSIAALAVLVTIIVMSGMAIHRMHDNPWALQHQHPPHDVLGQAQQLNRGQYGASGSTDPQDKKADECMQRGGTPYWVSIDAQSYKLTCVLGNAVGVTSGDDSQAH